jgi:hypothetical protein
MSATTVWGCASRTGGLAAETSVTGRVIGGHSYDELALELPEHGIDVDLDHEAGTELGQLIYGEVAADGRLNVVCVLDDDRLAKVLAEQPVFFSTEIAMAGGRINERSSSYVADRATLLGIALTVDPLTVGATPIKWRSGDCRRESDRYSWPMSWRTNDPLLARAVDHVGTDLRTRARRLVDLRQRDDDYAYLGLKEGDLVRPGKVHSRELPGGLRRGAPGRILSVR